MYRTLWAVGTLLIGACVALAEPVKRDAVVKPHAAFTGPAPTITMVDWKQDEADGKALLDATWAVVTTAAFQDHLAAAQNLHVSAPNGEIVGGEALLARYLKEREPTAFFLESKHRENGDTNYIVKNARFETKIGAGTLALWRMDNEFAKACAINTIAHEWTHAIGDGSSGHIERYTDKGWQHSKVPLVSYTTGSIAQCTRLGTSGDAFWKCVESAGSASFNAAPARGKGICTDGAWLK
jgi:hypothetical protein